MRTSAVILAVICVAANLLPAQLVCRKPVVDLGRVEQARRIPVTFSLENGGTVPIRVRDVRVSCFCAKVEKRPLSIPASGRDELVVVIDTGAFEGPVSKSIFVAWQGKGKGVLELAFRLDVHPSWRLDETILHLGGGRPGDVLEGQVTVHADPGVRLFLGAVREPIGARLLLSEGGESGVVQISCAIPMKAKLGRREALVEVRSDDPRKPNQFLRIIAVVEGDLRVKPRRLGFGLRKTDERVTRTVVLSSRDKRPFKILRVPENAFLIVDVDDKRALPVHRLRVTLPPVLPVGPKRGDLWVETDHPEGARIRLPYAFRITKP